MKWFHNKSKEIRELINNSFINIELKDKYINLIYTRLKQITE